MDGSFQSIVSQSNSATEMDSQYLWDHLHEVFGESPQSDRQGSSMKMFKAINLIKDEIVVVQELTVQRDEQEKLMRLMSFDSNLQQESEIRVFEKYLFSRTQDTAVFWLEMEYCQMGTLHDIARITKLAFSQGEIAFMLSQIFSYLIVDRMKAEDQNRRIRPLLDSKYIFLTNQGILKLLPFPLFSQHTLTEIPRNVATNKDLIALIALMDNNKHGCEENYSPDLRELVDALNQGEQYEALLNDSKIICENRSRFEYIKRSIYATRKRSMENYRKRSMSQFVPDTLKKLDASQLSAAASVRSKSKANSDKKKKIASNHPSQHKSDENAIASDMNSLKSSHRIRNVASSALSQDLKDISQISFIHSGVFSLGSDGASLGSNVITSQLLNFSKYSFNTTNAAVQSPRMDNIIESQGITATEPNVNQFGNTASPVESTASLKPPGQLGTLVLKRFFENHPDKKKFKVRRFSKENKPVSDTSSLSTSSQNCSLTQVSAAMPVPPALLPLQIIPSEIPEEISQEATSTQSLIESPIIKTKQKLFTNQKNGQTGTGILSSTKMIKLSQKQPRYSPKTECPEMQSSSSVLNSPLSQEFQRSSIESTSSVSSCTSPGSSPRIPPAVNDLASPQKQKKTVPLLRSHSDEIEVFTLQEYMTHKRNSSPVSRLPGNKKTESPKVEKPYSPTLSPLGIACPPTIITFDSSSKKEPFSIKRLLQKPINDGPADSPNSISTPKAENLQQPSYQSRTQQALPMSFHRQQQSAPTYVPLPYKPIFQRDSQKSKIISSSIITSNVEIGSQNSQSQLIGNSFNILPATDEANTTQNNNSFAQAQKDSPRKGQPHNRLDSIPQASSVLNGQTATTIAKPLFSLFPNYKHDFTFIKNNLFESPAGSANQSYQNHKTSNTHMSYSPYGSTEPSQTRRLGSEYNHSENLPVFQSAEGQINQALPSHSSAAQSPSLSSFLEDKTTQGYRRSHVFASVSSHHSRSNSPFSVSTTTTSSQHSKYQGIQTNIKQIVKQSPIRHANRQISPFDSNKSTIQSPLSASSTSWSVQQQLKSTNTLQQQQQPQLKAPIVQPMRRKYGKDLTHRFNEQGQYVDSSNETNPHSRRTSQLIFGSTIDMYDSFSTTDSNGKNLQVKGIQLLAKQSSLNIQNPVHPPTTTQPTSQVISSMNLTDFCFP